MLLKAANRDVPHHAVSSNPQSLPPSVPNISFSILFSNVLGLCFPIRSKISTKPLPNILLEVSAFVTIWETFVNVEFHDNYVWFVMWLLCSLFQLIECITKFIEKEMGLKYVTPPTFDIAKSYDDSSCLCPLIFILSPGADPMAALRIFANKMGYSQNFQSLSLGQGQVMWYTVQLQSSNSLPTFGYVAGVGVVVWGGARNRCACSSVVFLRTRVCGFNSVFHLYYIALLHTVHCLMPLAAGTLVLSCFRQYYFVVHTGCVCLVNG